MAHFRVNPHAKQRISNEHKNIFQNPTQSIVSLCSGSPPIGQLPDEVERTSCLARLLVHWKARYGLLGKCDVGDNIHRCLSV